MNSERSYCDQLCNQLKIGQEICFSREVFENAYPCGYPAIYNNHMEAFLSSKTGSAWGCWKVNQNLESDYYIVSRHHEGTKRVYVDPDRAHLFTEANGVLESRR